MYRSDAIDPMYGPAASFAALAKTAKRCQQALKLNRLGVKLVTTRGKCPFALAGQRMRR